MAHGATALKVATVAAIFMVLVLSSEGESPAAPGTPSCKESDCISKCPSKCRATAKRGCAPYKSGTTPECMSGCYDNCGSSCWSACNNSSSPASSCPEGDDACYKTCTGKCDKKCSEQPNPQYKPCISATFHGCKKDCEAGCKGEKVQG